MISCIQVIMVMIIIGKYGNYLFTYYRYTQSDIRSSLLLLLLVLLPLLLLLLLLVLSLLLLLRSVSIISIFEFSYVRTQLVSQTPVSYTMKFRKSTVCPDLGGSKPGSQLVILIKLLYYSIIQSITCYYEYMLLYSTDYIYYYYHYITDYIYYYFMLIVCTYILLLFNRLHVTMNKLYP